MEAVIMKNKDAKDVLSKEGLIRRNYGKSTGVMMGLQILTTRLIKEALMETYGMTASEMSRLDRFDRESKVNKVVLSVAEYVRSLAQSKTNEDIKVEFFFDYSNKRRHNPFGIFFRFRDVSHNAESNSIYYSTRNWNSYRYTTRNDSWYIRFSGEERTVHHGNR